MHSMVRKIVLRKLSYQAKGHCELGGDQGSCDERIFSYGVGRRIGVQVASSQLETRTRSSKIYDKYPNKMHPTGYQPI